MDQAIKAKWVAALRSGEYRQTTGTLKDDVGHCCLGVLCEVMRPPEAEIGPRRIAILVKDEGFADAELDAVLTDELELRWGIHGQCPRLTAMNDGDLSTETGRHTFAEIADFIDREL